MPPARCTVTALPHDLQGRLRPWHRAPIPPPLPPRADPGSGRRLPPRPQRAGQFSAPGRAGRRGATGRSRRTGTFHQEAGAPPAGGGWPRSHGARHPVRRWPCSAGWRSRWPSPYGVWPLSLVAVVAFSLLVRGRTARQGAWSGFAFGLPFFLFLLKWLHVVGWDATIGLAFIQALFVALLGAAFAVATRLPAWPLWGACLWVTEEFLRDRLPFGGFPWGRLAFANSGSPYTPLAALGARRWSPSPWR